MKKSAITQLFLTITLVLTFLAAGCKSQTISDGTSSGASDSTENTASAGNSESSDTTNESLTEKHDASLSDLTSQTSGMISKIDNSSPTGTAEEHRTQYLDLKNEVEKLETELDRFEDSLENDYRSSNISRAYFLEKEREIENLEELLDATEEKLDFTFGMES